MGQSADAYIRFGYVLPDLPDDYDWDSHEDDEDGFDIEDLWVRAHAPESVLSLALTDEEKEEWNALPYQSPYLPSTLRPEQEDRLKFFRDKADKWYDAKRAWLDENPCLVDYGYIGSYDGEDRFLYFKGTGRGLIRDELGVWANWEAVPLDFNGPSFQIDAEKAKDALDEVCRLLGREPSEEPGWHLYPNYG